MTSSTELKRDLRKHFRTLLQEAQSLADDGCEQEADALMHRYSVLLLNTRLENLVSRFAGTWAAFQPMGFEPDIRPVFAKLSHIDWVFPRVDGETMSFFRPSSSSAFVKSPWGVLEPDPARSTPVNLSELSGLLIPGLAFDSSCNRLGRGRGFYDRFLAEIKRHKLNALTIGVGLDLQIWDDALPVDPHDLPLKWVLTESRCFGVDAPTDLGDSAFADILSERKAL